MHSDTISESSIGYIALNVAPQVLNRDSVGAFKIKASKQYNRSYLYITLKALD